MSLSSVLLACEPLRSVNRFYGRLAYEIAFVGPSREPVVSGIGIAVEPSATFEGDEPYDLVVVVSAYDQPEGYKRALRRFLRRHARRGVDLCGIDFGAVFLAEAGLLDGHRATLHWEVMDSVVDRFPPRALLRRRLRRRSCPAHLRRPSRLQRPLPVGGRAPPWRADRGLRRSRHHLRPAAARRHPARATR